ncbi:MAG: asparagine synthase-related protein [Promethearchaeia archaeon]
MFKKINLQYNNGFKWNKSESIYSKGHLFDKKENLYQGEDLNIYFNCLSEADFKKKVITANGCFAVIVKNKNKIFVAVDRLRSMPLFYSLKDNIFYLSDNAYWIKNKLNLKELNKISEQEFLLTGYVTGKDTLFTEIKQVQAGEYLVAKEESSKITIETNRYYRYLHKDFFTKPKEKLFNKLDGISEKFIRRLIKSVNKRTIVIPLSGGYDSRYCAAMLRKLNYKNVICFSYGRKGYWESEISKRVASKLGYKWYFVEYTKNKWKDWSNSSEWKKFLEYGNNLASLAFLQDWPAIWELKKENKIPDDAIFVPGHTGDLLGGSWTPEPLYVSKTDYNLDDVSNYLIKKHYCLLNFNEEYKKNSFLKKITMELNGLEISDVDSFVNLCDYWNVANRQAKFIINSVRAYEFFDYEWRIPLWDNELTDFWSRVPLRYRIKKELYEEYLFENIFKKYCILFNNLNKKIKKINSIRKIKSSIKKINFFYRIVIKILSIKKYLLDYYTHPMNWYGIVSYYRYLKMMPLVLTGMINTILARITIENIKENKFRD